MMGERKVQEDALFYEFSLERHVPEKHLLRAIDGTDWRRPSAALYLTLLLPCCRALYQDLPLSFAEALMFGAEQPSQFRRACPPAYVAASGDPPRLGHSAGG